MRTAPITFLALTLAACTPLPPDPGTSTSSATGDASFGVSETGAPTPTSSSTGGTSSASSTSSTEASTTESGDTSTGAESSSGPGLGALYDPCDGAAQCDPAVTDGCAEGPRDGLGFCSLLCTTGQPCPADESGLGTPTCILELFDAPAACALTCRDGPCPPDLECTEFGGFLICM